MRFSFFNSRRKNMETCLFNKQLGMFLDSRVWFCLGVAPAISWRFNFHVSKDMDGVRPAELQDPLQP